jgi:hypothetical protein
MSFTEPIRGINVRYVKQSCCGAFAIITVDFEPAYDYEFVSRVSADDLPPEYVEPVGEGIQEAVAGTELERARAVLTAARWHEVDSNEMSFREAGRRAVSAVLEQLATS